MPESLSCAHVHAGQEPLLTIGVGGIPLALCVGCVLSFDRQIHLSLITHNADPSQGHEGRPPAAMVGRERTALGMAPPPVADGPELWLHERAL
jgi:hypothetical protein